MSSNTQHQEQQQPPPPQPTSSPGDRRNKRRRIAETLGAIDFTSFSSMSLKPQEHELSAFDNGAIYASSPSPHMTTTDTAKSSISFAPSLPYNLPQASFPHQQASSLMKRSSQPQAHETLRIGNCSLEESLLSIPPGLPQTEHIRRQTALASELAHQEQNPPVLPPSRVKDLPPKPFIPDFLKFRDGISESERLLIEARNNEIAAEHQRIDRQRNNQAAKKSRQARLEALGNTRVLLNEKTAECAWFRMKLLALGGSTSEWRLVPKSVKQRMIREIDTRVKAVELETAETKKKDEAKKRAERNKRRVEVRSSEKGDHHIPHGVNDNDESASRVAVVAGRKRQRPADDIDDGDDDNDNEE